MQRFRTQRCWIPLLLLTSAFALLFTSASALAAPGGSERTHSERVTNASASRWTAEALADAIPMPLTRVRADQSRTPAVPDAALAPIKELAPSIARGPALAERERGRFHHRLHDVTRAELRTRRAAGGDSSTSEPATSVSPAKNSDTSAKNYGSSGLDFTSSRLIPSSASQSFPYSTVGRLFFSDRGEDFVCTAAVVSRRLVITAAHCVHGGPGIGFFEDFLFVPAYRDGDAPFGSWTTEVAWVTSGWADSGVIPNAEDFALLEVADQDGQRIGDVTGNLRFRADRLADNHLHLLGYPIDFDDGEEMHQVTSGDWFDFGDGTVAYGSDMGGGASGSPWIQNFNVKSAGQVGGRNIPRLAVVGVTSYGFLETTVRAQGASILSRSFRLLWRDACNDREGNC